MSTTRIVRPGAGETYSVTLEAEQSLSIGFDTSAVSVERTENDLIFRFDDNSEILVDDFFATGDNPLPNFVFDDGMEISSAEVLSRLSATMDITPAAGPASSPVLSGGSRVYAEGAGDLVDGLNGLDGLGIGFDAEDQAEGFVFTNDDMLMVSAPALNALDPLDPLDPLLPPAPPIVVDIDPTPPVPPTPIVVESANYHTRLVVTDDNGTVDPAYTFQALDEDGNLIIDADRISFGDLDLAYFTNPVINPDGSITIQLTQAGLDALNNGTFAEDMLTIIIDGDTEYKMPLLIHDDQNNGQSYTSADEAARAGLDTELKAEWYATDDSLKGESVLLGGSEYNNAHIEGMAGAKETQNEIRTSGDSVDTINISGAMIADQYGYNTITTGAGKDTVTVGSMEHVGDIAKNIVDTGDDDDTVIVGSMEIHSGVSYAMVNDIKTGEGNDTVEVGTMRMHSDAHLSYNQIFTDEGDDTITVGSMVIEDEASSVYNSIYAGNGRNVVTVREMTLGEETNSRNRIETGDDVDTVTVGSMTAASGDNFIDTGKGDDTVVVQTAITAKGGENIIETGKGNDTVEIKGDLISTEGYNYGTNTINTGDDADKVHIAGSMYAGNEGANEILSESGNDEITFGSMIAEGGQNSVDTGDGDDKLTINGSIESSSYGSNRIETGDGKDTVTISGSVLGEYEESVTIYTGDDDDMLTIDGTVSATGGDGVYIDTGDGNDTMTIGGISGPGGRHIIRTGSGDDTLTINSSVIAVGEIADTEDGNDKVTIHGDMAGYVDGVEGIGIYLNTGAGDDTVTLDGFLRNAPKVDGVLGQVGSTTFWSVAAIYTEGGNDEVTLAGMESSLIAGTTIDTGSGDDTVNVGAMITNGISSATANANYGAADLASYLSAENAISTDSGNDRVNVGDMQASGINGLNTINTGAGDDTIRVSGDITTSDGGKNQILAGAGNDTIDLSDATIGENGLLLDAGAGDDIIFGGGGYNTIYGGAGNDTIDLSDISLENVLVWKGGDQGTGSAPAVDVITGFNDDRDVLDLSGILDSLQGNKNLDDLISFSVADGNTTINIASADDPSQAVQQIVLQDVMLDTSNGTDLEVLAQQIILQTS